MVGEMSDAIDQHYFERYIQDHKLQHELEGRVAGLLL
jgi:hypothetical protein